MKLDTLALRSVLRFKDLTTLDLRNIPPGLVAITGPNGAGKTSLLEATFAGLYRQFPSRDKEVFDYVATTDGFIEVRFTLDGVGAFRSRVALDGPHRKSEAVLEEINADGMAIRVLNDGKLTTFDTAIRTLLPPPELLLASVFASQNRAGSFRELDRKARKDLFATLLGLDHYAEMATRASQAVRLVEDQLGKVEAHVRAIARDADPATGAELDDRAHNLNVVLHIIAQDRGALEPALADLEAQLAARQADVARHAAAAAQHTALTAEGGRLQGEIDAHHVTLARLPAERAADEQQLDTDFAAAVDANNTEALDTSGFQFEIESAEQRRRAIHEDADGRIAKNRTELLDHADEIGLAVIDVGHVSDVLDGFRSLRTTLRDKMQRTNTACSQAGVKRAQAEHAVHQLERVRRDAGLLTTVPFGEKCGEAGCSFVSNAVTAKAQIPDLEQHVAEIPKLELDYNRLQQDYDELQQAVGTLSKKIDATEADLKATRAMADLAPALAEANAKIAGHEQRKLDADALCIEHLAAAGAREDARQATLGAALQRLVRERAAAQEALVRRYREREATLDEALGFLTDRLATVNAEGGAASLVMAQTDAAASEAAALTDQLAEGRRRWEVSTANLATAQAQRADVTRRQAEWQRKRQELAAAEQLHDRYQTDLVEWQTLGRIFGPTGVPVLEIDAAGPGISALTTEFLAVSGFGFLTCELITQTAKVSKGRDGELMKEVFDLRFYDARDGGAQRELGDLSGGEQIIGDEALKLAIAIYNNQHQPAPLRTMFRDETTGALDAERALAYVPMLRRAQEVGGFHHVFMVTHNRDVAALADAHILVDDGQAMVMP